MPHNALFYYATYCLMDQASAGKVDVLLWTICGICYTQTSYIDMDSFLEFTRCLEPLNYTSASCEKYTCLLWNEARVISEEKCHWRPCAVFCEVVFFSEPVWTQTIGHWAIRGLCKAGMSVLNEDQSPLTQHREEHKWHWMSLMTKLRECFCYCQKPQIRKSRETSIL